MLRKNEKEDAIVTNSATGVDGEGNGTLGIEATAEKKTIWEPKKAYETYLKHHERHQDHLANSDSKIRVANDHLDVINHKLFHHEVRNELLNLAIKNSTTLQIDNVKKYIETVVMERFSRFRGKPRKGVEAAKTEPARDCLICAPSADEDSRIARSIVNKSLSANVTDAEDLKTLSERGNSKSNAI